ncbi:MAG: hypothetical protein LBL66_04220 [Clostridiales bacterium]|nr:hypothetical protein [Clostridiales bacterium]
MQTALLINNGKSDDGGQRVRNERVKRGAFLCSVEIAASRFRAPRNKSNDNRGVSPRKDTQGRRKLISQQV